MKIAIIGGGASGMVTAYLLDRKRHQITVLEKEPILGGHIRTLNKNILPDRSNCDRILEAGVLEFPVKFHNFIALMEELEIELEPVNLGSSLFLKDGRHFLSAGAIAKNFQGIQKLIEYLRLDTLYARSAGLWIKTYLAQQKNLHNQSLSQYLRSQCIRNCWIKLLVMYSYSLKFELINNFPAELAIPTLKDYTFVDWLRIKGGVYSYIERILDRFKGKIIVNAEVDSVARKSDGVEIKLLNGETEKFDKIIFATPPDRVMKLLFDPTDREIRWFSPWQENLATTIIHTDTSLYDRYGIEEFSEFDFFETENGWGYNAYLNQICGISSPIKYSLAFDLDRAIDPNKIIHSQDHSTPLYTVPSFRYRNEIIQANGKNNTYHTGAYLADGLHEGAIASAIKVAQLIK
ncbi:MAG: FAD-dependent oxidoreductase [Prochloraceae cyanobacterium]